MIGLEIDMETANNITRLTLTDYRDNLKSENTKWETNPKSDENKNGYWLHPQDYVRNIITIIRIENLLEDFGGELYGKNESQQTKYSFDGLEIYFQTIVDFN